MSKLFRPCVLASVGIVAALAAASAAQAQRPAKEFGLEA